MSGSGDFEAATERIVRMIRGEGADHMEGLLPEGYGSTKVIERHARLFAAANDLDLAMILPVLLTAFSGATQGAYTAPLYSEDWTANPVPLVFQFFGIAESGARKSTVIKEGRGPLEAAMIRGTGQRRAWCVAQREKAMKAAEVIGVNVDADRGAWEKVFSGGVCPSSITDSGTPEGIRDKLVQQGGHRVLFTGESDILREATGAYSKTSGGTLGMFIRGWDQETISVDRSGNAHLHMPEASFPFMIFVQPNSFTQFTAVTQAGYDEWIDKGVFGRAWLWKMPKPTIPEAFEFKAPQPVGQVSELMGARLLTLEKLEQLVEISNEYRAAKGIRYAWESSGADLVIEEKYLPKPERLAMDLDGAAGMAAFAAVQNMLLALRRALAEADATDPGISHQYHPLVSRFTDHVMRLAALLSLADQPSSLTVDTDHIVDVATRLMPWLWSGWVEVMDMRRSENAAAVVTEGMMANPKGLPVGEEQSVMQALYALAADDGPAAEAGFIGSQITERARATLSRPRKKVSGISRLLREALDTAAVEGKWVKRVEIPDPENPGKKPLVRYKPTQYGYAIMAKKF